MEYYAAIKKPSNLAICNDMDRTRGYHAKQNKSIRERQLSYDLPDMRNLRRRVGVWGLGKEKMTQDGIRRETNHKRLLISQIKLKVAAGRGVVERVVGLWTLGRVCAIVSAVNCVRLMIHRPVPLKQIIHYMLIKEKSNLGAPAWLSGLSVCL